MLFSSVQLVVIADLQTLTRVGVRRVQAKH
jgi:hypothetical protein